MDKETIFSQADSGSEEGQMGGGFYQALEARYRGSRECIKERFRIYLPFLTPWLELDRSAEVADLGCGRGEWLELLQEHGFKARGVDVDGDMLDCCAKNGFSVEKAEAVTFLKSLSDDSQAVVSAFHVVEHITFEHLQMLVSEAFRVLKPGGLLILETPNPENILVSTKNFYLDPTHLRPIPPLLLSFVSEYYGFARVNVLRLQESAKLATRKTRTLYDVLSGASPDYAVVAQKDAAPEQMKFFDEAFQKDCGLTLETLVQQYEVRIATLEADLAKIHNNLLWRAARWIKHRIKRTKKR